MGCSLNGVVKLGCLSMHPQILSQHKELLP